MLLHRIFLRLQVCCFRPAPRRRRAAARRGVALGAGALAGGAVLYPLFDVLERRCRPRARYETDERGHARPEIQMTGEKSYLE